MELDTYCKECRENQPFKKYDLRNYCPKFGLWGLCFTGGIRFYTFRELLIKLDIKRKATVWECLTCNTIMVECPYCYFQMEGIQDICTDCEKKYYICDLGSL